MSNGLLINEKEFMALPQKQQMCLLYQNQLKTMELIAGYKFYQKVSATIGGFLVAGLGIMATRVFGL